VSRFHFDNDAQRKVRDLVLGPGLYGSFAVDGRYVYIDKGRLAGTLQKRYAVDTILQRADGRATCIEEKIVRGEYTAVTLETMSCTVPGKESDGWMKYGQADWLVYAMCCENLTLLCHIIDFAALQGCFWPAAKTFQETISKQQNRTACRKVPLDWIRERMGCTSKVIYPTEEGRDAVRAYRESHYLKLASSPPVRAGPAPRLTTPI
jgi:hypothetical protein